MALADDTRVVSAVPTAPSAEYDRTPPQDIAAEQSVLGGMMLSKDAIADVIEVVRPNDFYRPAHQLVYDAILDLYSRGEPADAVTVSAELVRSGQLNRVGGAQYLHTLISMVPTAANAGYYASIVGERATLRRLVSAGTRIVQMGYDTASGSAGVVGSVDDVVDRAQAAAVRTTSTSRPCCRARWMRSTVSRPPAASAPASPQASVAWTRSPTGCTRAR
jgi:replicative DNA helicase